jgi:MFS family permease
MGYKLSEGSTIGMSRRLRIHTQLSADDSKTGSSILVLGYANFILVPLSNIFGRRSVTLVCSLICVIANAWQAFAGSYNSFLGARILVGFGAAINETIMTVVIADIVFLHERGAWVGLYL